MAAGSAPTPPENNSAWERERIAAAQVDPRSFAPLYELHHKAIYLFVLKRLRDHDHAGDLTQQVFLKAMLALPRYRYTGVPFKAWLYRIAMNEVLMHFRSSQGRYFMDVETADAAALLEETTGQEARFTDDELGRLATALGKLRPEQASLVELHWFDGLSYAEVGEVLGIAEDAAKMRTHRVLQTLRGQLKRSR